MTEESETFSYEIVLIDFGFAYARLAGEGYGLLPTSDVAAPTEGLHIELGIAFERLRDHWDWEYMDCSGASTNPRLCNPFLTSEICRQYTVMKMHSSYCAVQKAC